MYHVVLNIVCFETFSQKRKENKLHRKCRLFGGPAGNLFPPTILQIKQFDDFISFTMTRRTASGTVF